MSASVGLNSSDRRAGFDRPRWLARFGTLASLAVLLIVFACPFGCFPDGRQCAQHHEPGFDPGDYVIRADGLSCDGPLRSFDRCDGDPWRLCSDVPARSVPRHDRRPPGGPDLLAVAAVIGVFNGLIVSYLGISAFIATLATGSSLPARCSASRTPRRSSLAFPTNSSLSDRARCSAFQIRSSSCWLSSSPFGCCSNTRSWAGISMRSAATRRPRVFRGLQSSVMRRSRSPFVQSAPPWRFMAASVLGAGRPQGVGDTYLLNAFAAVFIGASSLRPGNFHIIGTFIGVLLIGVINNGLSIMGVPTYWQYIVQGVLLIIALFSAGLLTMRRR